VNSKASVAREELLMRIQELADKMNVSVHTIRYYEKEGLLDDRHVRREKNNYRSYTAEAIERLKLIKKFQGIGCSLIELKHILQDHDTNTLTNEQVMAWIISKMDEIERKKEEYDQMLATLNLMLEYRKALESDPEKARALLAAAAPTPDRANTHPANSN
jgi:MerR family copper efflux transcriptional regulator